MSKSVVTVIGSINYDLVTYMGTIANAGETKAAKSFETHYGGKGLNQAISTCKLIPDTARDQVKIQMCANVGDDTFGPILKDYLVQEKVNIDFVDTVKNQSTGVAVIVVEEDLGGENRILITAGANGDLQPTEKQYERLFQPNFEGNQFVILENETPNTLNTIEWLSANRPKVNICYNPSPFKDFSKEVYSKIDVLIVNETEALMCSENILSAEELDSFKAEIAGDKIGGYTKLANKLANSISSTNLNLCIITLGSQGALYSTLKESCFFESNKISKEKVVDTTGAGDTFLGGIISQLSLGKTIGDAMKFASKASSLTVQAKGAAEAVPYYKDVMEI